MWIDYTLKLAYVLLFPLIFDMKQAQFLTDKSILVIHTPRHLRMEIPIYQYSITFIFLRGRN